MQVRRYRIGVPIAVAALITALWASGCGGCGGGNADTTTTTTPQPAAKIILLRRGGKHRDLEVLLVRRDPEARLAPGVWVFPGGAVDSDDGVGEIALRVTAVGHLVEQAGIEVDAADLVPYARWISPGVLPIRFDTRYYLALAPADSTPRPDGSQIVEAGWFAPKLALDTHHAGELLLDYSTTKHLESLVEFANTADALETARGREVKPVELRIVSQGDKRQSVLPDQHP